MPIPEFDLLSRHYPDYWSFPQPNAVRKLIGGEVTDPDITNTCTIRLSHALNATGVAVPKLWQAITNRRGANGGFYIIRVVNFAAFIEARFGKADVDVKKQTGAAFDFSSIAGKKGIIAFEIGFRDATGHFDLWYGDKFSHQDNGGENYFVAATRVRLWATAERIVRAPV